MLHFEAIAHGVNSFASPSGELHSGSGYVGQELHARVLFRGEDGRGEQQEDACRNQLYGGHLHSVKLVKFSYDSFVRSDETWACFFSKRRAALSSSSYSLASHNVPIIGFGLHVS